LHNTLKPLNRYRQGFLRGGGAAAKTTLSKCPHFH
jgi:hypothetical protein